MKLTFLLLVFTACALAPATPIDLQSGSFPITAIDAWGSWDHVPRRYQHVVPFAAAWPVRYFASDALVCLPDVNVWMIAKIGDRPACRWQHPRGP